MSLLIFNANRTKRGRPIFGMHESDHDMPHGLQYKLPTDFASFCQPTAPLNFFAQHPFVRSKQMRVARLQCPCQFARNQNHPQTYFGSCAQDGRSEVSSMCIAIKNEAVCFTKKFEVPPQESHIPLHDSRRHPPLGIPPNVRALWRSRSKGCESCCADLFLTNEDHLRQEPLKFRLVTDCSHVCDCGSTRCQGRPAPHGNSVHKEAVGSLTYMPTPFLWNQADTGLVDVNENTLSLGWVHVLQEIAPAPQPHRLARSQTSGKTEPA